MAAAVTGKKRSGFPPQIKYIIGNEACERFSFYGMKAILVVFMTQFLLFPEKDAKGIYHMFVSAAYFLPLLGGFLADRFWGKYRTIMWLSYFYCAGHAVLAFWENKTGLYVGLALIAFGAGGIKPCVSTHVGDQFNQSNSHLLQKVYDLFYFSINFGSFFSTLLTPLLLKFYGPRLAFGVPGILMFIATYIFWAGRKQYVIVPPTGKREGGFFQVVWYAITHCGAKKAGDRVLDVARQRFTVDQVEAAKSAFDVFKVLLTVSVFWALWDQTSSTWIIQAQKMNRLFLGINWEASQIHSLNPILILILIPVFSLGIYPAVERMGIRLTPLRKMGAGMVVTGFAFLLSTIIQYFIDKGHVVNVGWQFFPFFVITAAEIMVSITGLEFAYTQAPRSMKGTIMSLFFLTVSLGNFLTGFISFLNPFQGASEFLFYTVLMFVVSGVFMFGATRYQTRNYIETAK